MSKAVWIVNLPKGFKNLVEVGQQISAGDILAKGDGEIKSPVDGLVKGIGEDKLRLEFEAEKISGQGINRKNNWGKIKWQPETDYSQLNADYQGEILILNPTKLTSYFVSKARTLGVKGLIIIDDKPNMKNQLLPILYVNEKKSELIKKRDGVECLLDTSNNCLLVPKND